MFSFNRSEHFSADFCDIVNGDFHTIPHHYEALVFINFFHAAGYCDIDTAGLLLIGQVVCDGNFRLFVQRVLYCIQAFIDGALCVFVEFNLRVRLTGSLCNSVFIASQSRKGRKLRRPVI